MSNVLTWNVRSHSWRPVGGWIEVIRRLCCPWPLAVLMWPNVVGVAGHGTSPVGLQFTGERKKSIWWRTFTGIILPGCVLIAGRMWKRCFHWETLKALREYNINENNNKHIMRAFMQAAVSFAIMYPAKPIKILSVLLLYGNPPKKPFIHFHYMEAIELHKDVL